MQAQKYRFETIQCDSLQMGKGVVDLVFFSAEEVFAVPKIQLALKNETTEFLGIGTIEWIGFPELGLGCGGARLDEFVNCHDKSFSVCFILSCSHVWSIIRCFVISWIGMEGFRCTDGCADWHAVDMGAGVGRCDGVWVSGLEFPEKLRMV